MSLGPWGEILVMAVGVTAVLLAILVAACFVGPGCLGFECLQAAERKKRNGKDIQLLTNQQKLAFQLPKIGPKSWLGVQGFPGGAFKESYRATDIELNMKTSPFNIPEILQQKVSLTKPPTLQIRLTVVKTNLEGITLKIQGTIMEAKNLPRRQYQGTLEPYLVLEVLSSRWTLQKTEKVFHRIQTRVVRHTHHPNFNHDFTLEQVSSSLIKEWCLRIAVYDQDRLTRTTLLCEGRVNLRDIPDLLAAAPRIVDLPLLAVDLATRRLGELLLGLCYFPTAQKLCVTVVKASKLKTSTVCDDPNEFYPYVKVTIVSSQGKLLKKRRTCFKQSDQNPTFNESLSFELPGVQLEHVAMIVSVSSRSLGKVSSSDGSESDTSVRDLKDGVVGCVVLGRNVTVASSREHWLAMLMTPRRVLSVWHTLT